MGKEGKSRHLIRSASLIVALALVLLLFTSVAPAMSGSVHDYLYMIDPVSSTVRTLDTENNKLGTILDGFQNPAAIASAPDGKYVFVSDKRGINIIDTSSVTVTGQIKGTNDTVVNDMEVSGDATRLFVAFQKKPAVTVYEIGNYKPLFTINLTSAAEHLELSPDGKLLYVSTGSKVEVYDVATGSRTGELSFGRINCMSLDPNATYLYVVEGSAGQNPSRVRAIKTSDLSESWSVQAGPNTQSIAITPDGRLAFTANHDDLSSTVIDLREKEVVSTVYTSIYPHRAIASSDGKFVYLSTDTGTLTRIATKGFAAEKVQSSFGIDNMAMARVGSGLYAPPATPTPEATPTPVPTEVPATPTPGATLTPTESPATQVPTETPVTPSPAQNSGKTVGCFGVLLPLIGLVAVIGPVSGAVRRRRLR